MIFIERVRRQRPRFGRGAEPRRTEDTLRERAPRPTMSGLAALRYRMRGGLSGKSRRRPKDWSDPAKLYPLELATTENRFCERHCLTVVAARTCKGD